MLVVAVTVEELAILDKVRYLIAFASQELWLHLDHATRRAAGSQAGVSGAFPRDPSR